jgi:hypothetical protein
MSKYIAWTSRICVVLGCSLLATETVRAETFELWSNNIPLTFSTPVGAVLTNFPVLVKFGPHLTGFDYADFANPTTNDDLRFAGPDLDVELPYEVESWDTNGTSYVWVRVPELRGTGETIRAYWGQTGQPVPAYRTNGVVWAADYVGVWHLNEEAAGGGGGYIYKDSTTNQFHGRDYVASTNKDGRIYRGQEFVTNTSDYIQVPHNSAFNFTSGSADMPFTLSAWVYWKGGAIPLFNKATNTTVAVSWRSAVQTNGAVSFDLADNSTATNQRISVRSFGGKVPSNEWTHVAMSYDASMSTNGLALYANGLRVALDAANSFKGAGYTNMKIHTSTVDIGASLRLTTYKSFAGGLIDEGRISRGVRSPEWIRAAYLSVASNDVFMTYGVVQTSDTGLGAVAQAPSAIRAIEATANGVMLDVGGGDNPSVYVCWDATDKTAVNTGDWAHVEFVGVKAAFESFNHVLTPLERGSNYAYRFYVTNSAGSAWSGLRTFTTINYPSVTQGGASAIGRYGATLNGNVTATGGESPLTGFAWWPVVAGAPTTTVTGSVSSGAFITSVTGLSLSTEYAFKAWASNVAGMVWSDTGVWTTRDMTPVTFTWSGPADGDWFTAANWTPNGNPGGGVDTARLVNAASSILLAGATEPLAAFVMTNGTLTFSTAAAVLRADHVVITGGTNTHDVNSATTTNADGTWAVDGRVYFACSNFTLIAPGRIDTDGKGYRSAGSLTKGYGPGGGGAGDASKGGGGGGHGSAGIAADGGGAGGGMNDSVTNPSYPGSAGGGSSERGGYGGGLVRIEATNTVTISGTITANGGNAASVGTGRGGGGAGGGIFIGCKVLAGTNGVIQANAGELDANGGPGGSGRIAISVDPAAQEAAPKPRIALSVKRAVTPNATYGYSDIGTLSFTDSSVFDGSWMPHTGVLVIPNFTNWTVDVLHITNGWLRFPNLASVFPLTVSNAMTISGSSGRLQIYKPDLRCGSLTLTNGASLYLYSQATNATVGDYGALVTVANDMIVGTNCWVYPDSVSTNGGSVIFRLANLHVSQNGGFNADTLGFYRGVRYLNVNYAPYGPGKGYHDSSSGGGTGGGYGGRGGRTESQPNRGASYPDALQPVLPGSGGAAKGSSGTTCYGGNGGGLVRIEATGGITLNGTLTVNGQEGQNYGGGGSGGGIFLKCASFSGSATGRLSAKGANGWNTAVDGAGGGGRIAVWYGPWNSGAIPPERLADRGTNRPAAFLGSESVICGTLSYTNDAENGTVRYVEVLALKGSLFLFR